MKSLVLLLAGTLVLTACGSDNQTDVSECLHSAIKAYPAWPDENGPVLEGIKECRGLTADQKAALRNEMTMFVNSANSKIKGG